MHWFWLRVVSHKLSKVVAAYMNLSETQIRWWFGSLQAIKKIKHLFIKINLLFYKQNKNLWNILTMDYSFKLEISATIWFSLVKMYDKSLVVLVDLLSLVLYNKARKYPFMVWYVNLNCLQFFLALVRGSLSTALP